MRFLGLLLVFTVIEAPLLIWTLRGPIGAYDPALPVWAWRWCFGILAFTVAIIVAIVAVGKVAADKGSGGG